jgi:hypothetical protein
MNWFAFTYWWFVWLFFILGMILIYWLCNKSEQTKCPDYSSKINLIDKNLDSCCNCYTNLIQDTIAIDEDTLTAVYNCDDEARSGGDGITTNKHTIGKKSGIIHLNFDMQNVPDKLEVYYEGKLVASTTQIPGNENGYVGGENGAGCCSQLSFNYVFNKEDFCIVVVSGGTDTSWTYTLGCPL